MHIYDAYAEVLDEFLKAGGTSKVVNVIGFKGETFIIEVPEGKDGFMSEEQAARHERWVGGPIHVIRNAGEARAFIKNVIGNRNYGM